MNQGILEPILFFFVRKEQLGTTLAVLLVAKLRSL